MVAAVVAHGSSVSGGYFGDDYEYFAIIRSLTSWKEIWTNSALLPQYYPITFTTLLVQDWLHGPSPFPHHVFNIALHAANSSLILLVLRRLTPRTALLSALVFAVHPLFCESVAVIAQRKELLATAFAALSLLSWCEWIGQPRPFLLFLTLAFHALSLLSKPILIGGLPFLLLVAGLGQDDRRRIAATVPGLAVLLSLVSGWLTLSYESAQIRSDAKLGIDLTSRANLALTTSSAYLAHTVFPFDLRVYYPMWELQRWHLFSFPSPLVPPALLASTLIGRKRWGWTPAVSVAFYFLTIAPVSGLAEFGLLSLTFVSDHLAYPAVLGIVSAIAHIAWCEIRSAPVRRSVGAVAAAICLAASIQRSSVFGEPHGALYATLRADPNSSAALFTLGTAMVHEKQYQAAANYLERAVQLNGSFSDTFNQLGVALWKTGRREDAKAAFEQAITLNENIFALANLGRMRLEEGDYAGATEALRTAVERRPAACVWRTLLAESLARTGHLRDAVAVLNGCENSYSADLPWQLFRVSLLLETGADAAAESTLGELIGRFGERKELVTLAARAELQLGNTAAALSILDRAAEVHPGDADIRNLKGAALASVGRFDEAVLEFEAALRLAPDSESVKENLQKALADVAARSGNP